MLDSLPRHFRLAFVFILVLGSLSLTGATPQDVGSPQNPIKSATALQTVGQLLGAAGWSSATLPTTIIASGTLTRGGQSQVSSITLKQRGSSQHRFELQDNGATATTIVNGLTGMIVFSDGTRQRLPPHLALSIQSPTFPFLTDLLNTSDLAVDVDDLGTDTVDGVPCVGVLVARHAPAGDPLGPTRDLAAPLKIWVSQQTALPVRIDFVRLALDNHFLAMHFSRSFSDYRPVNGVAVPFTQEERFEGQLMYRIQFTTVQFGAAIPDSEFTLPKS
jgi:outer membrane lipoprotein-sorting protein